MPIDSKNIFIICHHKLKNIHWLQEGNNEWIYIGCDSLYEEEKVKNILYSFFDDTEIYIVIGRQDSRIDKLDSILTKISSVIKKEDFILSNQSFSKMIQFSKIGVLRKGMYLEK